MVALTSRLLVTWLFAILAALAAAEAQQPASSADLVAVLSSLEDQMQPCPFQCFMSKAPGRSCDTVNEYITADLKACLRQNCITHEYLEAERLVTATCGVPPRNIQTHIRVVSWTLWAFAAFFLAGRLAARSSYFGGMLLGPDDWAIVLSFVVLTAVTIGAELMVVFGLGTDIWTLDDTHINIVLILFYIAEFAYVIESTITKISILLLYLRIFPDRQFRKHVFVLIGTMGLFCVAFVVTLLTYCVPFSFTWERWDNQKQGKCIDMDAQTYVCAALNIVLDLWIFFIPIPQLLKLDLTWKKKVGIILTFCVGLFVTICSMIRLRALVGWTKSANAPYDFAALAVWSLIELDVGVICACMPGMAGLFRRLKKRGAEYINTKSSQNASRAMGTSKGTFTGTGTGTGKGQGQSQVQTITKTTMISVKHTRERSEAGSESELELVDRNHNANNFPGHYSQGV